MSPARVGLGAIVALALALNGPARVSPSATAAPPRTDPYGDPLPDGAELRLGTIRWRHGSWINSLVFSPDGKTIRSCADGTLYLWDRESGKLQAKIGGGRDVGRATALSADGKTLAATGWSGAIRLWDVPRGEELPTLRVKDENEAAHPLALSPDGALLATGINVYQHTGVRIWNVRTGKVLYRLPWDWAGVYAITFSPDGKTVAYGGSANEIWLFDVTTGKERVRLKDTGAPSCLTFSADGKMLAATGLHPTARVWDVATGELRREYPEKKLLISGDSVAFSLDGKTLAQGGSDAIVLWDVAAGKELRVIRTLDSTDALAFSPDGKVLASGGRGQTIRLWDVGTGKSIVPPAGHLGPVTRVGVSPDGRTLVTSSNDQTIRLWNAATGAEIWCAEGHSDDVTEVLFSPDGRTLISASQDKTVRWWDATTGKEVRNRPINYFYNKLTLSPDGKVLACEADNCQIHLWDATTGKELRLLGSHKTAIGTLAFAAGGKILVSTGYYESAIRLWDLRDSTWRPLAYAAPTDERHIPPLVAVSPDGRTVASQGKAGTVQLWEVASGKERQRVGCLPVEDIAALAFSPGGDTLAVADQQGRVYFWCPAEGRVVAHLNVGRLAGNAHPAIAFSPDGRRLATIRNDSTVLLWPVPSATRAERHDIKPTEQLWTDLGGTDAEKAFRASRVLLSGPGCGVLFLKERIKPVAPPDPVRVARLLRDIGDEDFATRETATTDLEKLGEVAGPALREALRSSPTPEAKFRIERALGKCSLAPHPEALRWSRALEILEQAETRGAAELFGALAKGAPEAWLTMEAKQALTRLALRKAP